MIGGEIEQIKKRLKKAAGVLVDDDSLTSEGKLDQVVEKVKIKVERVKGKLQQAVDQMKAALARRSPISRSKSMISTRPCSG